MTSQLILFFFIVCLATFQLTASFCFADQKSEQKDFYVLTIPKSGSHLILKMLNMLSKKDEIARPVLNRWKGDFINDMSAVFDKKGEGVEKIRKQHEEERCS